MTRVHAAAPLCALPGGPGGSGLPGAVTKRVKLSGSGRRAYATIGFDPKGTSLSSPADRGAVGGLFDGDRPGAEHAPVGPRAKSPHLRSLRSLADDRAAGVGDEALPYLSRQRTARAMDAIRAAPGELGTSLLRASQGNCPGAAYAARRTG